ncbi:EF containing protein [Thalassiosira pseudonana CCMP1335]|uniref:EF containing protein n=1 Tax=Thalassiosira pseudonana TaxID=35128 RepID=B5YMR6_THAPS|nr:EF containing protein [Thalassiosira pseudonana CCMP1335]ACI64854.1 EF containing protein [Thalassiosira pseudonana CCMP1335]
MLFSGLGDVEKAQETLSVGVGALAGSTIMLLTVPWAMSVYYGRVDFSGQNLEPNYKGNPKLHETGTCSSLSATGVALTPEIHHGAKMMMLTTIPYFLIQVPAFFITGDRKTEALKAGAISLSGALAGQVDHIEKLKIERHAATTSNGENVSLLRLPPNDSEDGVLPEVAEYLKSILGEAFRGYDVDRNGCLCEKEFGIFLTDFHETISSDHLHEVFLQFDSDGNGTIDFDEFIAACYTIIKEAERKDTSAKKRASAVLGEQILSSDEGEEDEAEEQRAIKRRAFTMLTIGTALVLLFSDPMVDVLSETAVRLNVPAFYVSFILAPLASNASEVIASQYYAAKKTRKTITVALTALEGAASMNNTFCLAIFMALIFFRGLAWKYSAETIAIILVQFGIGIWAMKDKMSALSGFLVMAIFPLSVLFVALLEYLGLD